MIGFTRSLAREVGSDGITVNAITPGAIQTEAELEMFPEQEALAAWLNDLQAVQRRGLPNDIAGAAVFLASDAASFISGQTLNVDGGWAMH
jgi:NAD(P)-dependent dehydrogenase (short-subunit alcohol dehydrogenase family)